MKASFINATGPIFALSSLIWGFSERVVALRWSWIINECHSILPYVLFQDLSWLSQSAPPTPRPQHTRTHAYPITEAASHKQSMLYFLQLEIQEIHFQNAIDISIFWFQQEKHMVQIIYKALLEIFLLESLKYTYLNSYTLRLIFNTSNNMCYIPWLQNYKQVF